MIKVNTSHFQLLGCFVKDRVTGVTGVVTSLCYDLYGCIQVVVQPMANGGTTPDSRWYDVTRIEVVDDTPVMQLPDFTKGYVSEGKKGCADKPAM